MPGVQERRLAHDLTVPWVLPTGPSSVTLARRAARDQLRHFGITTDQVVDVVELVVSELTANVVKHAGGRATLRIQRLGDVVRVEVCDANSAEVPIERPPDVEDVAGRGLLLVSSLASSWGYKRSEGQKCTWAEIDVRAAVPRPPSG
jgi:anti-sigma regulatory factor (Ser/Thr protein kinase)